MSDKPDAIFFLRSEEDGQLYVVEGVHRQDGGSGTQAQSTNTIYWQDEHGSYIPCSCGGYHVHRGKDALRDFRQCNCPHALLQWLSKIDGIMICQECHRTFTVEGGVGDVVEVEPPICALEKDGKVCVYTPRNPPPNLPIQ